MRLKGPCATRRGHQRGKGRTTSVGVRWGPETDRPRLRRPAWRLACEVAREKAEPRGVEVTDTGRVSGRRSTSQQRHCCRRAFSRSRSEIVAASCEAQACRPGSHVGLGAIAWMLAYKDEMGPARKHRKAQGFPGRHHVHNILGSARVACMLVSVLRTCEPLWCTMVRGNMTASPARPMHCCGNLYTAKAPQNAGFPRPPPCTKHPRQRSCCMPASVRVACM